VQSKRLWSSLSVRQAVRGLSVAVALGLGLTALEMGWSVLRERDKVDRLAEQIMDLLDGSASVAVWTFDPDLAARVANDALTLEAVQGFELRYRNREVLAASHNQVESVSWLGLLVFEDMRVVERPLYRPREVASPNADAVGDSTGSMVLYLDLRVISADLWAFLGNALVGGMVRNLLLGLALTLVFNRSLVRPLMALGRDIDTIDPTLPEEAAVAVPRGHDGDELGAIASRVNQLLQRLAAVQADLRRLSTRDPLTRLANRALYEETLASAVAQAKRGNRSLAVMAVKMRAGAIQKGGDAAVQHIATRLVDCTRATDLVARIAGDEFVIILRDADAPGAMRVADRVMAGLGYGLALTDGRIDNSPAIGVALFPTDGEDTEALTTRARTTALVTAAGTIGFATSGMYESARAHLARSDALVTALEQAQVDLVYQAQVEAGSRRSRALVVIPRWTHGGEILSGADLVTAARTVGLDVALLEYTLREALRDAAAQGITLPMVIRCADRQLLDPEFPVLVERQIRFALGIEPGQDLRKGAQPVILMAMQTAAEDPACRAAIARLKELGLEVWLDITRPEAVTIGALSGVSCTGLEFIAPPAGTDVAGPVAALLALAQSRGLLVAARNVTTAGQWAVLLRAGCRRLRGALIAPAVPLGEVERMVATLPDQQDRLRLGEPEGGMPS